MYFYDVLKTNRNKLNALEEEILKDLLENHDNLKGITVRGIATKHFTSPNTITRLVKKLGFTGFTNFKEALNIAKQEGKTVFETTSLDEQIIKTKQILNQEVLLQVLELIHVSDTILVNGVGLSRFPAEELHYYLEILGKNSQLFLDPHMVRYAAKKLRNTDLLITFSISGEPENIVVPATIAKTNLAKVISITGFAQNSLSKISDIQLYAMTDQTLINGIDMTSRLSFTYIVSLIFREYLKMYVKL
ncbi:MurR/RpiR family transcriptional regulator [Streptococcus zalophi]|uniref:MurR/RpiR family transcriptional regulator n=1 Tax=Streptococcus zalophi TaxID=640031 RepID=A0A934UCY9_9STRE|nr:MurR/RpiR family transcriptional regulator [Streptococcus zalophi]MBJ8349128.1 MurR/RpiR family transcriptional regulator [Streptococcus zalophi]MCR8967720.1 MurR/RpiR family transcriptional regulator [Streptococcus zalophi]